MCRDRRDTDVGSSPFRVRTAMSIGQGARMSPMNAVRQLRRRPAHQREQRFPWEIGHASPEDRALGLELQLIELNRRRRMIARPDHPEARRLDVEIEEVLVELGEVHPHQSLTA